MEEEWIVSRSKLREVWLEHLDWSHRKMGEEVGRSKSWVKKWLPRLRSAPLEDREVLNGERARKRPPLKLAAEVVEKIIHLRDHLPSLLGRTPGPLPILYYLQQDQTLKERGVR